LKQNFVQPDIQTVPTDPQYLSPKLTQGMEALNKHCLGGGCQPIQLFWHFLNSVIVPIQASIFVYHPEKKGGASYDAPP
jgi:hypothetical protein